MTRSHYPDNPRLTDALGSRAVPLETTDPVAASTPLQPIADSLRGIDVIGLGEATHRPHEFVQLKHRLVRALAVSRGLRLVGLEAPFSETMALHDYVVYGTTDLEEALDLIDFRIYQTAEFRSFCRWMRSFNEGRPPGNRLAIYGFDVQSAAGPACQLADFIDASDDAIPGTEDVYESLAMIGDGIFEGSDVDETALELAENVVSTLEPWFERTIQSDAAPAANSPMSDAISEAQPRQPGIDTALARQHYRTLRRACEFARTGLEADTPTQWGLRDRYMAETIHWIRSYDSADRVAVWAHDNHVKRGRMCGPGHPAETMGAHLASRYGRRYYALGLQFGTGAVRAFTREPADGDLVVDGTHFVMGEHTVPTPTRGSIPSLFATLEAPVVVLDYRTLPKESRLRRWFATERSHRYVTGVVEPDSRDWYRNTYDSVRSYDGLAFVCETSPTTPTDR